MQYITNKDLIQKLKDYKKAMDYSDLSNKDHDLTIATINQFTDLIAVNDMEDSDIPFEIPLNFIDNFEYDDLIAEIAETCTPKTYSELTKWLHYDNEHIRLLNDYVKNNDFEDYMQDFSIIYLIDMTIRENLKQDLITILTNICK